MIDDEFGITKDNYNWILIKNPVQREDQKKGIRGRKWYFPNLELMSRHIIDSKAKDTLGKIAPDSFGKSSVRMPQSDLISIIESDLQTYIHKLTSV
jgi:hypothetical protein